MWKPCIKMWKKMWKNVDGNIIKKPFLEHNRKGQKAKKPKTKNHQY